MPWLSPWQRGSHAPPGASRPPLLTAFSSTTTKRVLPACPVDSSLVLFGLRNGGKSQGGPSRIPPRLQAGLGEVFGTWDPPGDDAQTLDFANLQSLLLQRGWVGTGSPGGATNGRVMVLVLWLSQVLGVTSSAEPSLVLSQPSAARAAGPGSLRDTPWSWQPQVGSWRQLREVRSEIVQSSWQEPGGPCPLWGSPVPKQWIFNSAVCFPQSQWEFLQALSRAGGARARQKAGNHHY